MLVKVEFVTGVSILMETAIVPQEELVEFCQDKIVLSLKIIEE